jgi:dipeptidyl aminopeptidase/acylaminoacyl peptidase
VLAPNYRGSTGYGAQFQNLSIGDPGGADLEDIVCAAKWLCKQQNIEEAKIAIIGASYGGYLTLMALTKRPERFSAGVAIVPAISGLEMYDMLDPLSKKEIEKMMGGSPKEKQELYRDRSPFTHISKIRAPLMIIAGEKDARCPIEIIKKFSSKLQEMCHPHELVIMEKAGHISSRTESEKNIENFTRMIDFLRKAMA